MDKVAYTKVMATRLQKDLLTFLPIIISSLLALSSYLFYTHTKVLPQKEYFHARQNGAYIIEVKDIRGFMTFDYINKSFHLPDEYLRSAFSVTNTSYPKITIEKQAALSGESVENYVTLIEEKVAAYTSTHGPK